ncbi:hypothetical protein RvY_10865 [Ramazzottius varieornatus]|uniref:GAF domain-containing protein n=1 Tax=Ramazzottius varieornatus TaxID=947166 RepID=A0A1D1VIL0_RAMVA|nr:hypothetical protein RvY_10865 [Ramazzottius varieornatus]
MTATADAWRVEDRHDAYDFEDDPGGAPPKIDMECSADGKCARATQTLGKVPKVYLTEAWKYMKIAGRENRPVVDFRHYPQIGTMRTDKFQPVVPDNVTLEELEQEPSLLRVIRENHHMTNHTIADHFDASARHCMHLGNFAQLRVDPTYNALVNAMPTTKSDLWFATNTKSVENQLMSNKVMVKEFIKQSKLFSSRDLYLMMHLKRARRKPIEGLKAKAKKEYRDTREADIHAIEQYEMASDRRESHLQAYAPQNPQERAIKDSNMYHLPPDSHLTHELPEFKQFKEPSVVNLSEAMNEVFHYAKRQKNLLNADQMAFYVVRETDGPIVSLEKYPPRRVSQYTQPIPESLQYGMSLSGASGKEGGTEVGDAPNGVSGSSRDVREREDSGAVSNVEKLEDDLDLSDTQNDGGEPVKSPPKIQKQRTSDIVVDYREPHELITKVVTAQTWFLIPNVKAYLSRYPPILPVMPEDPRSIILVPVGLHSGKIIGFLSFIRCGRKPTFTESEADISFVHANYLLRTRYYAGVRSVQRQTERNMLKYMHDILKIKDPPVEEFLHQTLILARTLADADRAGCFLANQLTESLSLDRQLIVYLLESGGEDPVTGKPACRKGCDIRMSVNSGIVGCAYRHRRTYSSSGTQFDQHFFSAIDKMMAHRTESLVCVPFLMGGEPYGLLEVLNKKSSSRFSDQDIAMLHLNSVFPALGILIAWYRVACNKQEYLWCIYRARIASMRNRRVHRTTRLWRPQERPRNLPNFANLTPELTEPGYFYLDAMKELTETCAAMIKSMAGELKLDDTVVWNFVHHVKNYYTGAKFHNWRNTFAALQTLYAIMSHTNGFFSSEEQLTMAVAVMVHGIDHCLLNGAITEGTDLPGGLAHVYGITIPEAGSVRSMSILLREKSTNVFHMFRSKYWRRLKENARNCVLATHLPGVPQKTAKLKALWTAGEFKSFEIEHRQFLRELVATFLRRFCVPLFDLLRLIFPDTGVFLDACVKNLEKLDPESRFDQLSTLSHIDGGGTGHKRKDRHVSSEMKRMMRRNIWEDMRIPFEQRDIEYKNFADMPHLWHKSEAPQDS